MTSARTRPNASMITPLDITTKTIPTPPVNVYTRTHNFFANPSFVPSLLTPTSNFQSFAAPSSTWNSASRSLNHSTGPGFMPFSLSGVSVNFSAASLTAPPPSYNVPTLGGTATAAAVTTVAMIDGLGDEENDGSLFSGDADAVDPVIERGLGLWLRLGLRY
jgi:hypothetical protein